MVYMLRIQKHSVDSKLNMELGPVMLARLSRKGRHSGLEPTNDLYALSLYQLS